MSTSVTIDKSTSMLRTFTTALQGTWGSSTNSGTTTIMQGRTKVVQGICSAGTKSVQVPSSPNRYPVWFGNPSVGTIPAVVEATNAFVYVPTKIANSGDSFCFFGICCEDLG